jgi:hypothetical protein
MRIDSSGNVGIGTTSPGAKLEVGGSAAFRTDADVRLTIGSSGSIGSNDSNFIRAATDQVICNAATSSGRHSWEIAGSEAMRIGSSGNVGINASSPGRTLDVNGVIRADGTSGSFELGDNSSTPSVGCAIHRPANNTMAFVTGTNERMRIDSSGKLGTLAAANSDAMQISSGQSAGTSYEFLRGMHSGTAVYGGTLAFRVFTNGNVQNTNNSYGAISDIKLKENIVDANSQWDDLKAIQIRNYNFIEGQTHTQIGVVAQEVETVSPGLVTESPDRDEDNNDLGTVTKSVNYSVLYMKAVKALQEAMERIETLEQRLTDAGIA